MLNAADISTADSELASRVYWAAIGIAPCLPNLDGTYKDAAKNVLKGVLATAKRRGDTAIASQGVGSARVSYRDKDWFSSDDKAALRAICSAAGSGTAAAGAYMPAGSFPPPDPQIGRLWPEPGGHP